MRLLVAGRVQGVCYRQSARDAASALDLVGWVRNRDDGRVEALAQGAPDPVERFIGWCRSGPPAARVTTVEVCDEPAGDDLGRFSVRSDVAAAPARERA